MAKEETSIFCRDQELIWCCVSSLMGKIFVFFFVLFGVFTMIKGDLQGTNNVLKLLENMNLKVAEEYKGFADVASGLRVFVERLKANGENFDEYVQQIDDIEQQVTDLEVVISMLDKYVSLLESKVQSVYQMPTT